MEKIYGLLGRRLEHSWSVPLHQALGCGGYRLIPLEPEAIPGFLAQEDIGGLNVTIPYKREVMPLCDRVDDTAAAIGCVNTLLRQEDGRLYGYNTDAAGFMELAARAGIGFCGKKVVILGSGGASRTVQYVAKQAGAREVRVISRTGADHYGNLSKHRDAELLVNTTPVGMFPDNLASPVELAAFPACEGVLELIYNPRRTGLLMQAEARGLPCSDGLPMLVAQAAMSETLFTGRSIPRTETDRVYAQMRLQTGNLVLIGMPGCGKSTVGAMLAGRTGREAIDIDRQIEKKTGLSIPQLLAREGEACFRRLEQTAIAEAGKLCGKVIITGGGAVLNPRNYAALHQNGRIYQLERSLDRLPVEGRPLSQERPLSALWAEREPLYARFRDAVIDNNGTADAAVERIWREYCAHSGAERPEHESAGHPAAGDLRQGDL